LNYFNYSYFEKNKIGIIIKDEIEVRSGPSQNDNKIIIIHSGVKILIMDQVKNWYEVKLPNGEVGWVESNCFEII
jgi:SH3-like domain-containing protein